MPKSQTLSLSGRGSCLTSSDSDGRGGENEKSLSAGGVFLETRTAYLSLKGTSHSLVYNETPLS